MAARSEVVRGDGAGPGAEVRLLPVMADADEPLLWEMLRLAAHAEELSVADLRRDPDLARYVDGWGRAGDHGIKAVDGRTDTAVGAAWSRLWQASDHGYGFIDERTPELAIAVAGGYRGMGVGRRMLEALIGTLAVSYAALSLSVRLGNPALWLYRQIGFAEVDGSVVTDRSSGTSITMRLDLRTAGDRG